MYEGLIVAQHILDENEEFQPVVAMNNDLGDFTVRLLLQVGDPERPRQVIVPLKPRMVIGCGGDADGVRPDLDFSAFNAAALGMSECHAAFLYRDDLLYIEDLNSPSGTRINGLTIPSERRYRLRNGDELEFGRFLMSVRVGRVASSTQFR